MSAQLQLFLVIFNFFYGNLSFLLFILNYFFIKNETLLVKVLLTMLFSIDLTIIYLIIIYKINYGIFHIYYLLSFLLGFYLAYFVKKHVKFLTIKQKLIDIKKREI